MAAIRRIRREGIFELTAAEYLADPCQRPSLNRGTIQKLIESSPAHAWTAHPRYGARPSLVEPDDATGAMDVGTAVHAVFLTGDNVIAEFPFSSWRSDAAKARRAAAIAEGKIPLLTDKALTARDMVRALERFRERTGAFQNGRPELSVIWREGEVSCRARVDWLPDDPEESPWDLKTTLGLATAATWKYRAMEVAADVQDVWYRRGLAKVRGRSPKPMKFCVVEQKPPFGVKVFYWTAEAIEIARAKIEQAMPAWADCQASGVWPNYLDEAEALEPSFAGRSDWGELTETARAMNGAAVQLMIEQQQFG
jgi:PDDEXK-like uncharacterized protein DUF3799